MRVLGWCSMWRRTPTWRIGVTAEWWLITPVVVWHWSLYLSLLFFFVFFFFLLLFCRHKRKKPRHRNSWRRAERSKRRCAATCGVSGCLPLGALLSDVGFLACAVSKTPGRPWLIAERWRRSETASKPSENRPTRSSWRWKRYLGAPFCRISFVSVSLSSLFLHPLLPSPLDTFPLLSQLQAKKKILEERREARRAVMAAREMETTLRVKMQSASQPLQGAGHSHNGAPYVYPGDANAENSAPLYGGNHNHGSSNRGPLAASSFGFKPAASQGFRDSNRGPGGRSGASVFAPNLGTVEEVDDARRQPRVDQSMNLVRHVTAGFLLDACFHGGLL